MDDRAFEQVISSLRERLATRVASLSPVSVIIESAYLFGEVDEVVKQARKIYNSRKEGHDGLLHSCTQS